MPKLNLKRTPAEEAERQWRKQRKASRKAAKGKSQTKRPSAEDSLDERDPSGSASPSHKRQRKEDTVNDALYDSGEEYGPQPSTSYKPDYEAIRAQLEEERFREKMHGALEDDIGLYGVEENLNSFAHVPDRWRERAPGGARGAMAEDEAESNPHLMDDEEYAEWIRAGMWKYVLKLSQIILPLIK